MIVITVQLYKKDGKNEIYKPGKYPARGGKNED